MSEKNQQQLLLGGPLNASNFNFIKTIIYVLTWYISNMVLILLNKYLLAFYGYKFPIFLTLCHMISSGFFSLVAGMSGVFKLQNVTSINQLTKIAILAIVMVGSVMCGNISLRFVPVSFNQAVGATTPFFAALLAGIMQNKTEHSATYATLVPVVLGTVIASNGEPNLHFLGLFLCISATFLRGLKSVLQAILMSGNNTPILTPTPHNNNTPTPTHHIDNTPTPTPNSNNAPTPTPTPTPTPNSNNTPTPTPNSNTPTPTPNPSSNNYSSKEEKLSSQNLLMMMSPFAVAVLMPFVLCFEPYAFNKTIQMLFFEGKNNFILLFTLNIASAYVVNLSNFLVTKQLGALSLQVLGNLKGVVAAGVSIGIFKNPVTPLGLFGYGITMGGVVLYKEAKKQFKQNIDQILNLNNQKQNTIL